MGDSLRKRREKKLKRNVLNAWEDLCTKRKKLESKQVLVQKATRRWMFKRFCKEVRSRIAVNKNLQHKLESYQRAYTTRLKKRALNGILLNYLYGRRKHELQESIALIRKGHCFSAFVRTTRKNLRLKHATQIIEGHLQEKHRKRFLRGLVMGLQSRARRVMSQNYRLSLEQ
jgi:hypothetical protein